MKKQLKKKLLVRLALAISSFAALLIFITTYVTTYSEYTSKVNSANATRVEGATVYINDLDADYYYFMSLNYTTSPNQNIPTLEDKHIYDDTNIIETTMTYNGVDKSGANHGYVSIAEQQDKFIYYKHYEVNNNGTADNKNDDYVKILLIDNPFTDRPNNKAFNGWVADYAGSKITFDADYYERYITIPVTYTNNKPDPININLYASWIDAKIAHLDETTSSWSSILPQLNSAGMKSIGNIVFYDPDVSGDYIRYIVQMFGSYDDDALDEHGNSISGTCFDWNGCVFYKPNVDPYDESKDYYELNEDGDMVQHAVQSGVSYPSGFDANTNMGGFYKKITLNNGASINGYYDNLGFIQTGTCQNTTCEYYELMQYKKSDGTDNLLDFNAEYYYLVTRDTNIVVLDRNQNDVWGNDFVKPFTLTAAYNDVDNRNTNKWIVTDLSVIAYSDLNIENIYIENTIGKSTRDTIPDSSVGTQTNTFYGNWFNVRLGRGILRTSLKVNFNGILGTKNDSKGTQTSLAKFKFYIESGYYNAITPLYGKVTTTKTAYVKAKALYGNDYDRAILDNQSLQAVSCLAGSNGGKVYSETSDSLELDSVFKSGWFGSNESSNVAGVYVGGRDGGLHYAVKRGIIEGGKFYALIGGPQTDVSRTNINDTYIYVKGGEITFVNGGAGNSTAHGNRVFAMVGGLVKNSVFGGSNASGGGNNVGTIYGNSYVYIGGTSQIGDNDWKNITLFNAESGSVFGHGNGNNGGNGTCGSNENSYVIIKDHANIQKNVYGGSNRGIGGSSTKSGATEVKIKILGGTIGQSVYGGGNLNGIGKSNISANVYIDVEGGVINGSVYGGSRTHGYIYGNTFVNVNDGEIKTDVYGGGEGGLKGTEIGTFIQNNVNVTIGTATKAPIITGSIYGGSSLGTVNGVTQDTSLSSDSVNVTINNGTMANVYGGAKGSGTVVPFVKGDINLNINGGTIGNVFGANNANGVPNKNVLVTMNNGNVGNIYGGGNQTSLPNSHVVVNNGTIGKIFGGSKASGIVTNTLVEIKGGNTTDVYGGNDQGESSTNNVVDLTGGTINNVYGGGSAAPSTTTRVELNGANVTGNVFGGGESASVTTTSTVNINSGTYTNIYGGSNTLGDVTQSRINAYHGESTAIFGGNRSGGTTIESNIFMYGTKTNSVYGGGYMAETTTSNVFINSTNGRIDNVFGGGDSASVTTSNVHVRNGLINYLYGGSNALGEVTTSNVLVEDTATTNPGNMVITYTKEAYQADPEDDYKTKLHVTATINNTSTSNLNKYYGSIYVPNSILFENNTNTYVDEENGVFTFNEDGINGTPNSVVANGNYTFSFDIITTDNIDSTNLNYSFSGFTADDNAYANGDEPNINMIFGGNNRGGKTINSNVTTETGHIGSIYGGGNQAISNYSILDITDTSVTSDVYGGGNEASLLNNSDVNISASTIGGNVFGGGNAGEVNGNATTYVSNSHIKKSIYAGGNGITAVLSGNTLLDVDGTTVVDRNVFGGGNAAATGNENLNNGTSVVNIAGATIAGNVYGGANTSVVHGITQVNIGMDAVVDNDLISGNISIGGTVFGGGEANESGSDQYTYTFISVTNGIEINIDGNGHNVFNINGSIFGSGNASSTRGYSRINISNYGTYENYKRNVSIQRSDIVTISNSNIELIGATDRTNEYSDVLFTFSRLKELKIKNNTTLYLEQGTNLLQKISSKADIDGEEVFATVDINDQSKVVTKNTDNRIYMKEGKNLNVATSENLNLFGQINGMTFFGMYTIDRNNVIDTAMYDKNYDYGDTLEVLDRYHFNSGSYVLGAHKTNHNTHVDGFYSNFKNEDDASINEVRYINPTPEDSNYYMWVVGESVFSYSMDMVASKYVTMGTTEMPLFRNYQANSTFSIVGFNYDELDPDISLVDEYDVPRVADTINEADNVMSLVMKSGPKGWITNGSTQFLTDSDNPLQGTMTYMRENTAVVPSFVMYLYHSKNLGTSGGMGSVTISLLVSTPVDDLNNNVERINIVVNLSRLLVPTSDYEAAITPGKQYSMFASNPVNINDSGSFSAYYSLYKPSDQTPYGTGYHRSLVSSTVFPENTKITMIDLNTRSIPEYYYYVISAQDVINATTELNRYSEVSYDLSKFVKMGSTSVNNKYNDASANQIYYNTETHEAEEEFIVIVDFGQTNLTSDILSQTLLMELRNSDNRSIISVLGSSQISMVYNVYHDMDALIDVQGQLSSNVVYPGSSVNLDVTTNYIQSEIDGTPIYDTTYDNQKLGVKLTMYDSNNVQVSGASLFGLSFTYNGKNYYPRVDGSTRINIAPKVANVSSRIKINTPKTLAPMLYHLVVESFGSPDGIYYGLTSSDQTTLDFNVMNTSYGLNVEMSDNKMFIDAGTGKNKNNSNTMSYTLRYESNLSSPNIKLSLYRRNYDTPYAMNYNLVDLQDYVSTIYEQWGTTKEYYLTRNPVDNLTYSMNWKDNLMTGTYKLVFSMYNDNVKIGDVYKYIIIR